MTESVFTYAAPGLKFGRGASDEIGWDALAPRILDVYERTVQQLP